MATIREGTKVPNSNFWKKSIDCDTANIYCSYQDVTCTNRDVNHHCIDDLETSKFFTYFVEATETAMSRIECSAHTQNRTFTLNSSEISEILGYNSSSKVNTVLKSNKMLSRRFEMKGWEVKFKTEF
jgi:hypothetical protein